MMMNRNIGIVAHVDAGKTTVTEQILFTAGSIRTPGRVDDGTAKTDWLEVERERGISVRSAATSLKWRGKLINLIDTPGHADFAAEVERSLRVLDGIVLVISAAEGVEAQTELLWEAAGSLGLPAVIFINKIDRTAANISGVLAECRRHLSPAICPLQRVVAAGTRKARLEAIDDQELFESLAELDDELLERFVLEEEVGGSELRERLAVMTSEGRAHPVLFGSALHGRGIEELLDAVVDYLPAAGGDPCGAVSGLVFKLESDPVMGRLAYVRLYSGAVANRDVITNATRDSKEKITQIRKVYVQKQEDVGSLRAGDIGIICGLNRPRVGDVLGSPEYIPAGHRLAVPLLRVRAFPGEGNQPIELLRALQELEEEDPLLTVDWMGEREEIQLSIMGTIQLEILESILRERFNLEAEFGKPSIIYRETPSRSGEGSVRYTMPKPCWAVFTLHLEPLPRGEGVEFCSQVSTDQIPRKYQRQIEESLPQALEQGLSGWEVTDLRVTLIDGEYHIEHTHPPDFAVATPMAVMDGLDTTGTDLLEPVLAFEITVPESAGGQVLKDLAEMRGEFENPVVKSDRFSVAGRVPAATFLEYPVRLSSLTGGRSKVKTRFSGYKLCPEDVGETCPRRGIDPRDRSRYILSARNAL